MTLSDVLPPPSGNVVPLLELNVENINPPPPAPTMNGGEWGRDVDCFCHPKLPQ